MLRTFQTVSLGLSVNGIEKNQKRLESPDKGSPNSGLARIEGSRLVPMNEFLDRLPELEPSAETVVVCHHGTRSAFMTQALDRYDFEAAYNLEGGLDAYSVADSSVPRY